MQGLLALVSPEFSDLDNTKRVRFYVSNNGSASYISDLIIGVMSDPTDTSTFTPIDTVFKSELSANWLEVTVNLPTGLGKYVALAHGLNSTYDYMWIDDFYYENIPSCFKLTNLRTTSSTSTSVGLAWTPDSYPNNWSVEYGQSPLTLGTGTKVYVSDSMTSISNLTPNTSYDFVVREVCSAGDTSYYSDLVTEITPTNPVTLPFMSDFESPSSIANIQLISASDANVSLVANSSCSGSGTLLFTGGSSSGFTGGSTSATPTNAWVNNTTKQAWANINVDATSATNMMEASFDLKQEYSFGAKYSWLRVLVDGVQISPDFNPSTANSDPCTKVSVDLSAYAGTSFLLSIQSSCKYDDANSSQSSGDNAFVDNLMIREIPLSAMAMASANTVCSGDTVMLYGMADGGDGLYSYSWSNGMQGDTIMVAPTTSSTYVFTVQDGNGTFAYDTVSIMVNSAPQVSISALGDPWCDVVDLFASTNGPGMAVWSNGASGPYTSVTLADGIAPNVSVMVMDTNGCVGSASGFVYADEYLQNYVMVAKNSIELPKKNKVIGGGVGVTDLNGVASIGNFSGPESTNGFVVAENLNLGTNANYDYFNDTTASGLMLPNHNSSTASGTTRNVKAQRGQTKTVNARNVNVTAERNSTVTLTRNLYGNILVKVGATVIFTDNNVQIGNLYVQNSANSSQGATIGFAQDCDFRVANYVYLGARSNFNPSMEDVTVYVGSSTSGGDFEFKPADTEINANIYVIGGGVKASSSNSKAWTNVNGRVIADNIYSKAEYIKWNGPSCNSFSMPLVAQKRTEVTAQQDEEVALTQVVTDGVELTLAPNPTSGVFLMQLNGSLVNSTEDIQVTITSQDGRMIENKTFNNLNGSFNREFSLEKYSNGIYFVTILVGNEILKEKIVLTR